VRKLRLGAINPIWVAAVTFIGMVGVSAVGTYFIVKSLVKTETARTDTRQGLEHIARAAERVTEGKPVQASPQFPDSAMGQMTKVIFQALEKESKMQTGFLADLDTIGWAWVMSPEALRTEENVDECLRRLGKARALAKDLQKQSESNMHKLVQELGNLSTADYNARKFYEGFMRGYEQPGGGRALALRTFALLSENFDALQEVLQMLKKHSGRYSVASNSSVLFRDGVPDGDVETYNRAVERMNISLKGLNDIDAERIRRVKNLSETIKELRNP
jgi:hypothetical protein